MENGEDLKSILPYLPLILRSSSLFWPPQALESLKALSRGPDYSRVDSGEVLFDAIFHLRHSLALSPYDTLPPSAANGYALFFDDLMSGVESNKWFGEVVPALANLLLRLPSLLESHYKNEDEANEPSVVNTGLRLLRSQEAGIVYLSQELIGALLACSFFCLFPIVNRAAKHLPTINFDHLFAHLYTNGKQNQEHKLKCLIHYFERICSCMPTGFVSFERKVLPLNCSLLCISYPESDFWSKSNVSLCNFEVSHSGLIEDQHYEALEVDFANKYIGGGALHSGCVQEEIRFMINPELIVGMLFLPSMADNEAIEIVGAERFSDYTGYASSFLFLGDYKDKNPVDSMGRRKTRIVAIDALCSPRMRQYEVECILRETNKAFCGFFNQSNQHYLRAIQDGAFCGDPLNQDNDGVDIETEMVVGDTLTIKKDNHGCERSHISLCSPNGEVEVPACSIPAKTLTEKENGVGSVRNINHEENQGQVSQDNIGVATGNWGCGAFGGDPELKSVIQWLAASQALRPFILYYTFGEETLQRLEQASQWIISHEWTVGDLWNMLVEYSYQRLNCETRIGFLSWLLPPYADVVEE
eukprot:TRINITY_DN15738_c0_g1_i1.p1 TRINITY_DN15738_c0_g1~~TRINITY_DN15738_c0_g1_i1.p1  ORF type:complete len:586 (+),score=90.93 TRINITY_DN15738_c0_g1_i1:140-1897(+)